MALLAAALSRLAKRLERGPHQARSARTPRAPEPEAAEGPVPAPLEAAPAAAPAPRVCAVIGCRRPHRSQGYCAAHYQKRRLMVATNRLHPAWVENAAPHSLPDVILPRGRSRVEPEATQSPAAEPSPPPAPKVWVRKKGQGLLPLGAVLDGDTSAVGAGPRSPDLASPSEAPGPQELDHERAVAAAQRWVSDFLAAKRGG